MSIFDNVPLNTSKIYVMGKCRNGTEVYLPVEIMDIAHIKKAELINELNPPVVPGVDIA